MSEEPKTVGWRFPLLLVLVLVALIAVRGWQLRERTTSGSGEASGDAAASIGVEQVALTIDFGEGPPRELPAVAIRDGMTVAELMAATSEADPTFTFSQRGSAPAFLTEISGRANEGGGGRNWHFYVNGQHSSESFDTHRLKPGDRVLWKFVTTE